MKNTYTLNIFIFYIFTYHIFIHIYIHIFICVQIYNFLRQKIHYIFQAGLRLTAILLPQPLKCLNYKLVPPCLDLWGFFPHWTDCICNLLMFCAYTRCKKKKYLNGELILQHSRRRLFQNNMLFWRNSYYSRHFTYIFLKERLYIYNLISSVII